MTAPSSPGNSPDGAKRSTVGDDEKVHRSDEQWQSPRLANLRGKYGVDNAILSRRPCCHDQDAWWSVEVPRGASAGKVAVIGRELRAEWRRPHGTAVELQEEAVFTSPQTQYPIPVWSQTAVGTSCCVAPLDQRTAALGTRCTGERTEHRVSSDGVVQVGQRPARRRGSACPPRRGSDVQLVWDAAPDLGVLWGQRAWSGAAGLLQPRAQAKGP